MAGTLTGDNTGRKQKMDGCSVDVHCPTLIAFHLSTHPPPPPPTPPPSFHLFSPSCSSSTPHTPLPLLCLTARRSMGQNASLLLSFTMDCLPFVPCDCPLALGKRRFLFAGRPGFPWGVTRVASGQGNVKRVRFVSQMTRLVLTNDPPHTPPLPPLAISPRISPPHTISLSLPLPPIQGYSVVA